MSRKISSGKLKRLFLGHRVLFLWRFATHRQLKREAEELEQEALAAAQQRRASFLDMNLKDAIRADLS